MIKSINRAVIFFTAFLIGFGFITLSEKPAGKNIPKFIQKIKLKNHIYKHSDFFASEEKKENKLDEPELFAKYQMDIRTPNGETLPNYKPNYRINEYLKALGKKSASELRRKTDFQYTWIERGPGHIGGRTRGIAVDPRDPTGNTFIVGSVGGGVWKTTDGGDSWDNLTDLLPNLAASAVALCESNPDVIYFGTGEGFGNVDQIDGNGIWKSTDGGQTWRQLESTNSREVFTNVTRLVVDPDNPDIVLAAQAPGFNGGSSVSNIFKTTDGGITWVSKYESANDIQQIAADPSDFNILYATINAAGIIKSVNAGDTWNSASSGIGSVGRLELTVSPVNSNNIFVCANGGSSGTILYYSTDAGNSWTGIEPSMPWLGGQGWYDNTIAAHPFDENSFYVGGISVFKGTINNGSLSEQVIVDGYLQYGGSSKGVHVDQHNITCFVTDSSNQNFRMILGNDGGIYISDNAGLTFKNGNTGYNVTQFYGVDKKNGADEYVGGMQDNSTWRSPSGVSADSISNWIFEWGGDGYEAAWNYTNPNKILVSSQYNNIGKSTDGGNSYSSAVANVSDVGSGNAPFFTKIAKSKQDPDLIFIMGASGLWRSADFGSNWRNIKVTGGSLGGTSSFAQVKISAADPQVIWAGSNVGVGFGLYVSNNGGFNFSVTNGYSDRTLGRITGLATHPTDPNTAYATFSFADLPKILRTTDLGQSWEDISGFGTNTESSTGFPDVAVYSLQVMPFDDNIIWAGTEIGIFETTDNAASWHPLDSNLPPTAIYDLSIVNDQVVAATHGRGIFTVTLPQLAGYEPPDVLLAPILNGVGASSDGLVFDINFREIYDSTQFLANGVRIGSTPNYSTGDSSITVNFEVPNSGIYNMSILSFAEGRELRSEEFTIELFSMNNPVPSYVNDFEQGDTNFVGTDFVIDKEFGFQGDYAIHSKHPYEDLKEVTFTLAVPIKVKAADAFLKYDDIAIIEPGEPGSQFGDESFYDYVVVEGSKDGFTWTPLADGYDCRKYPEWEDAYTNAQPYYPLYKREEINLLDTFAKNDVILIRFRLFADPLEHGWGWAIDNLQIQENLVGVKDDISSPFKFDLAQNYPNPFNPSTMIKYSVAKQSDVKLIVYDAIGREVQTLVNSKMSPGNYEVNFDAANLASGVYIYRMTAGDFVQSRKLVLLK